MRYLRTPIFAYNTMYTWMHHALRHLSRSCRLAYYSRSQCTSEDNEAIDDYRRRHVESPI